MNRDRAIGRIGSKRLALPGRKVHIATQPEENADGRSANGADGRTDFYQARLTLSRTFMERSMPETVAHLARTSSGADTMMAMPGKMF